MKLLLAMLVVVCGTIYATPQVGDKVTLEDGSTTWTHGLQFPEKIQKRIDQWMDAPGNRSEVNSANWKGYFIELSISDQRLYVNRLFIGSMRADHEKIRLAPMNKIFGSKTPVHATWFSGDLVEYFGKYVGYTHVMSRMRIYRFKDGMLTEIKVQRTPRSEF